MNGGKGRGKGEGSNQPAKQSTGTMTNDKNDDGKKVGKFGNKKGRPAAEDAENDAIAAAMAEPQKAKLWHPILERKGPHPSTKLQQPLLSHAATKVNYRRCKDRLQNSRAESRLGWPKKRER